MAERGEPWPASEEFVGRTSLISQRVLVVSSLFVALAAGIGVAKALPVPDSAMQRVAWWLVAETAALAAVSALQLLLRRNRRVAALAPTGTALVIVLTAVAVIIAAPAPERPRDLVVTLGSDTELGLSPEARVEAAALFAPVPSTDPPATTAPVAPVAENLPVITEAPPTSVAGAAAPTPGQAVPTALAAPPPPPPTTAAAPPPTAPPTTAPPTTPPPTTAPPTTVPPTTAPAPTTTVAFGAQVLVSLQPNRSAPVAAMGASVASGSKIYLFVDPAASISRVRFWFGSKKGAPDHVENSAPFDLAGSASDGTANPYAVSGPAGPFSITVEVTFTNGSVATTKVTLQRT